MQQNIDCINTRIWKLGYSYCKTISFEFTGSIILLINVWYNNIAYSLKNIL